MFHNLSELEKPYKITDNTIINQKIKNKKIEKRKPQNRLKKQTK